MIIVIKNGLMQQAYDDGIEIVFENGTGTVSNNNIVNNSYITHPAFGDNLRGFWISKYEISKYGDDYKFVSGVDSYRNDNLDNYKSIIENVSNNYKLGNDASGHIVNNLEWGATVYLAYSKYGVCSGDGCTSIGINETYTAGNNKQDTTTRNVYGVYDMAETTQGQLR